jgi:hypothetical protein
MPQERCKVCGKIRSKGRYVKKYDAPLDNLKLNRWDNVTIGIRPVSNELKGLIEWQRIPAASYLNNEMMYHYPRSEDVFECSVSVNGIELGKNIMTNDYKLQCIPSEWYDQQYIYKKDEITYAFHK